jgi:protein dithiol:quinone oxidoreductase
MLSYRRPLNFAGALICFALLGYAYFYAQGVLHLEPCPLCIFQRITIFALGVLFLLAGLHHPRGRGSYVYAALILIAALATVGIAARHVYVQSQPLGSIPACGAPLNTLLQMFPVWEVVRKVLHAGGECAVVNWTFLGLTMPAWVLLWAAVLGAAGFMNNVLSPRPRALSAPFARR